MEISGAATDNSATNARSSDGIDPWRDPYARRGPRYYEDEFGNSASRPILLTEDVADTREQLTAADADTSPSPLDFVRVSGLRLLVARDLLEEFALRLESVPENEPIVTLAREIAEDLWEASWARR
jgi:hypothetical protein